MASEMNSPERDEQRLNAILEGIIDGFIVCDGEWRVRSLNSAAERILGSDRLQLLGRGLWDVLSNLAVAPPADQLKRVAAGEEREFELFSELRQRWYICRCVPQHSGGVSLCLHDITAQKELKNDQLQVEGDLEQQVVARTVKLESTLKALRISEERYRSVVEDQTEVICRFRPGTGMITFVNEVFCRFFGKTRGELLGRGWQPEALPEDISMVERQLHRLSPTNPVITVENRVYNASANVSWMQFVNRGLFDQQGRLVEIQAVGRDITERKKLEEELRHSEEKFRALVESSSDCIWEIDADGNYTYLSPKCEDVVGYSPEELIGKSPFCLVPDGKMAEISETMAAVIAAREPFSSLELPVRHREGWELSAEVSGVPFFSLAGEYLGMRGITRDITKRIETEEQLKHLYSELERRVERRTLELQETQKKYLHAEKLSAIGKLSASIAHELGNPLLGILFALKSLRNKRELTDDDRQLLETALGESERVRRLIATLRDFERPSPGKRTSTDLHKSLDSLLLMYQSEFSRKKIVLLRDYADLPEIMAVPDQIKQVFLNLLTNAVDACRPSGGEIRVTTRREGERVVVAITDDGIGIKDEEAELIFQPFYTTKSAVTGTGLGLSVSYGIVKQHHGEIRVSSRPGAGTTITVFLPIK
jgi:PAS domain S-box-containing protein